MTLVFSLDLSSSTLSITNSSFALMLLSLHIGSHYHWLQWICPTLMSYQLLIPRGQTLQNQQPSSLNISPYFSSSGNNALRYPAVTELIYAPPPLFFLK